MRIAPLVSTAVLARLIDAPSPPTVLDVRWVHGRSDGEVEYEAGHIGGSRYVDLDTELCGPPGDAGRRPIPGADAFAAAMRRHGVRATRPVVVYDGADSAAAARAWWLLRYFGHPDVRVLDGGYSAWLVEGLPVESATGSAPEPGDFTAVSGGMPVLDAAAAADVARRGVLLDARPVTRYLGEAKPADGVGGHIPGAVNTPTDDYLDQGGRFLSPQRLLARFQHLGLTEGPVGAYCGSGINATHTVLALETAGIAVALYPGSWSHWIKDPRRPVAVGPEPSGVR